VDGFGVEVIFAALVVSVTTWFTMADVLPRLLASPTYTAFSGYGSALRFDLVSVATPLALSMAEPMLWPSHVKFTLPVGVIEPEEVTAAVHVTFWP
jgi:hypothetical protein